MPDNEEEKNFKILLLSGAFYAMVSYPGSILGHALVGRHCSCTAVQRKAQRLGALPDVPICEEKGHQ